MGQAPSAEEYQSVSDLIDATVDELESRNVVFIPDVDKLEDRFFVPLGHIIAWRAAPEFGAAADASLAALSVDAELTLKEMVRNETPYIHKRAMRTDYPITRRCTTSISST